MSNEATYEATRREPRARRVRVGKPQRPDAPAWLHVGRFSEGMEELPRGTLRLGSYADQCESP